MAYMEQLLQERLRPSSDSRCISKRDVASKEDFKRGPLMIGIGTVFAAVAKTLYYTYIYIHVFFYIIQMYIPQYMEGSCIGKQPPLMILE